MTSYAVIMAGGSGERFWPVSRRDRPKQLIKLTDPDKTLLEEAVMRVLPLIPAENVIVATGLPLREPILRANVVSPENVLAEPNKRNTLGCLAWVAANLLARHSGNESKIGMAVLTADHKIGDPARFLETVSKALEVAAQSGGLVTIGIRPTRPETGYGYVEIGSEVGISDPQAYRSVSFREKPDLETALRYLESGRYLWNSGMFFWTLASFLSEIQAVQPQVQASILEMSSLLKDGELDKAAEAFDSFPSDSIDYALLEKSRNVYTVAGDFPWDDVGSWDALERSMPCDENRNVVQGNAILVDSPGTIVYNDDSGLLITAIGVSDLVIVVTEGAVMVCPKDQAQRVKEILQKLPQESPLR